MDVPVLYRINEKETNFWLLFSLSQFVLHSLFWRTVASMGTTKRENDLAVLSVCMVVGMFAVLSQDNAKAPNDDLNADTLMVALPHPSARPPEYCYCRNALQKPPHPYGHPTKCPRIFL